jgi:hypothetical protein
VGAEASLGKFLASLAVFLFLLACTPALTPRQTAEGYLKALSLLDFEGASQFVADEGRANFQTLRKLYSGLGEEEKKKFLVEQWKVTGEAVSGDTATVDFTFDQVKKGQLSLHRLGGTWRVDSRRTF